MGILDEAVTPVTPAISEDHQGTLRTIRALAELHKTTQTLQDTHMLDMTSGTLMMSKRDLNIQQH